MTSRPTVEKVAAVMRDSMAESWRGIAQEVLALFPEPSTGDAEAEAERRYPTEHIGYSSPPPDDCDCDECFRTKALRLAYAEGWAARAARQPRETVTTAEELDALPVGSVVLDSSARSWEKQEVRPDGFGIPVGWFRAGSPSYTRQAPLPATVLYRPEETP